MQNHRLALMLHENALRFANLPDPTDDEMERVGSRIAENFEFVPLVWQRAIAGVFAPLHHVPSSLIDLFIGSEENVAGPFIAASPVLTDPMLLRIIELHGPDGHTRAVARRQDLSEAVKLALRAFADPAIDRALELRQGAVAADSDIPPTPDPFMQQEHGTGDAVEAAALSGAENRSLFETALADRTGLSMTSARILCDDPTSKNLLFALRFMGCDTDQALQIFYNLAGGLANQHDVIGRFRTAYEAIDRREAVERVRSWQLEELRSLVLCQPAATPEVDEKSSSAA